MNSLNLYQGENSIFDYHNPEGKCTPMVELSNDLNDFRKNGVRIFAKLMSATPLLNIKSYPAFSMISGADLTGKTNLVESSSGNMASSLSILGPLFGINNTRVIVSNSIAEDKLNTLRLFGAEVEVNREPMCPDKDDPESGINKAKNMGKNVGWFNAGQYDNFGNPEAHYKWTGAEIWKQLGAEISVFVSTLGTTGTMTGVSKLLNEKIKRVKCLGVVSDDDSVRLGPRTKDLLKEISFDWQKAVDDVIEVDITKSYEQSLRLIRSGLLVGPSSGFTYYGLTEYLKDKLDKGELDSLRNKNGEVVCVFVCPDSPLLYLNEYIKNLGNILPKVINKDLLDIKSSSHVDEVEEHLVGGLSCAKVYEKKTLGKSKKYVLIDTRKRSDYKKFHIPGAKNVPFFDLIDGIDQIVNYYSNKKIVFIDCGLSGSARRAVKFAKNYLKNVYFMKGGMDAWSKAGLPTRSS